VRVPWERKPSRRGIIQCTRNESIFFFAFSLRIEMEGTEIQRMGAEEKSYYSALQETTNTRSSSALIGDRGEIAAGDVGKSSEFRG
jgi:hypothetical protein